MFICTHFPIGLLICINLDQSNEVHLSYLCPFLPSLSSSFYDEVFAQSNSAVCFILK